jgi:hypothetical protein
MIWLKIAELAINNNHSLKLAILGTGESYQVADDECP